MPTLLSSPACGARAVSAGQRLPPPCRHNAAAVPTGARHIVVARAGQGEAGQGKSVEQLLAEANALLDQVGSYRETENAEGLQASIDELQELGYVCDESGCVLILPEKSAKRTAEPTMKKLLQGNSWSIGRLSEPLGPDFTAVVSGPFWSIPMMETELQEFLELLNQLRRVVKQLDASGQWLPGTAERPVSRVKWDSPKWSLQATHSHIQPHFSMDITFTTSAQRPITTSWPATILSEVLDVLDKETGGASPAAPVQRSTPAPVSASA